MSVNNAPELVSEGIVVEAPMSFTGSSKRIWNLTKGEMEGWQRGLMIALSLVLIACAWTLILGWYLIFGLLVVPYRLIRRGSRKRKLDAARHSEMLQMMNATTVASIQHQQPQPTSMGAQQLPPAQYQAAAAPAEPQAQQISPQPVPPSSPAQQDAPPAEPQS